MISFHEIQCHIEDIIWETAELLQQLVDSFRDKRVKGRLVAKVNFIHLNFHSNEEEIRAYHFPSYQAEEIENVEEFYVGHMTRIASRLDSFHTNGSNLVIKNIEHIHIQLTVL